MSFAKNRGLTEGEVVARLANELPRILPSLSIEQIRKEVAIGNGGVADILLSARSGSTAKDVLIEVKSIGEPRMAEMAIGQLRRLAKIRPKSYLVFAAPYVSERAREICKSEDVGYIDLVGDTYLRFGSVLIDTVSKAGNPLDKRSLRSLFSRKATRVVRALLEPPVGTTRITDLAQKCSMNPGSVYRVIDLLETKGFVRRDEDKGIQVPDPRRLLLEWAVNWSTDKSRVSRYFSFERDAPGLISKISEAARTTGVEYALTGMAGASLVAPYTRYDDVWFYAQGETSELVKNLDLRPVSSGANVVILDPYDEGVFSGSREIRGIRVVSDVQLFVDLYTNPARGREQAEEILNRSLKYPEPQ